VATTIYQYPRCSTCRNALKWLDARGVAYTSIDIVQQPPSAATLKRLHRQSELPLAKLFNTSGESYRAGNFSSRLKTMSDADAYAALAADGKLIKRPLVETDGTTLVGFDEKRWSQVFGK
jgi:arsenate reductase